MNERDMKLWEFFQQVQEWDAGDAGDAGDDEE